MRSALPPRTDGGNGEREVRFVPTPDMVFVLYWSRVLSSFIFGNRSNNAGRTARAYDLAPSLLARAAGNIRWPLGDSEMAAGACANRNHQRILCEFNQVTRNSRYTRLTVEELATDCIDVRDLNKAGTLKAGWVTVRTGIRWPATRTMRAARYLVLIELHNQVVPQQVNVSWTPCNYGGARPWLHCVRAVRGAAVQWVWRIFLSPVLWKPAL